MAIRDGLRLASISGKPGDAQALRRDEEELQVAVEVVDAGLARGGAVAPGVDALHREVALLELGHLIFHQGDQRTDHQRGAAARHGGQLVAQRLAGAGGHDQQDVAALDHGLADGFLAWAEGGEAEGGLQEFGERPPCSGSEAVTATLP